jgi:hypothetical protein
MIRSISLSLYLLVIPFVLSAQDTLVIKPGPECGKDAIVWFLQRPSPTFGNTNITNYGNTILPVMEWTGGGIPGRRWVLIDFEELDRIPAGTNITNAWLSLYFQ